MKLHITLLLIFLSITTLFSKEFEVTKEIKENPGHLGLQMLDKDDKYDNDDKLCALLIVRCGVKDINFSNTASKVAQIDKQGEYYITMKRGARYIVLKKEGFGSFKVQFGLVMKSGSVYEMSADAKFKQASQVPVVITCNQNGAEVFVDGISKGKTQNKMLTTKIDIGSCKITIQKDGFSSQEINKNITAENYSFDFKLTPAMPAAVTINTLPPGAIVYIDNLKFGTTPKSSFFDAGTYPIRIEKENYETINNQITITEPETNMTYNLTDIRATLTIKTNKNATVTFNGKSYKGGIDKLVMLPQTISFKIEQEFCETINETYTLKKSEKKIFELYPEDVSATLTIKTHKNATVKFNGQEYKGGIENKKVSPQVLEISVTMPKAETIKRVITLKPRANETIEIYPEVQTGTIQVMTIPTTATIELKGDGGEHYTATGRKTFIDVPVGTYELIVTAKKHKTHTEDFRLIADDTVAKQISLEKGSDVPEGFVFVKGGTFQMGSNNGDSDEKPVHSVTVDDFYIGKYEVTQKEWRDIMGSNPSNWKGDNLPVEQVSWNDVQKFIKKLNTKTGLNYRLPTEAEWEFAARGGTESENRNSRQYSGSNNIDEVAWYDGNSGSKTHAVGTKKPNELGIYDMSGNVWEWCNDWYDSNYYKKSPTRNPAGANSGSYRVHRGGSWHGNASYCRVANRFISGPSYSYGYLGFRLARSSK